MNPGLIPWSPGVTLEAMEEQVIMAALTHFRNNKTATANALGIAIRTLDSKLEKYKDDERKRTERDAKERDARINFLNRQRGPTQSLNSSAEEQEKQRASVGVTADAGVRVEPTAPNPAQPGVSVQVVKEVQKVLPVSAPASRSQRTR